MNQIFNHLMFSLAVLLVSCESPNKKSKMLGRWKVESVVRLADNKKAPEMKAFFTFKKDGILIGENDILGEHKGNWKLSGDKISIISETNTTIMYIVELDTSRMTWKADLGEGELKFVLKKAADNTHE